MSSNSNSDSSNNGNGNASNNTNNNAGGTDGLDSGAVYMMTYAERDAMSPEEQRRFGNVITVDRGPDAYPPEIRDLIIQALSGRAGLKMKKEKKGKKERKKIVGRGKQCGDCRKRNGGNNGGAGNGGSGSGGSLQV